LIVLGNLFGERRYHPAQTKGLAVFHPRVFFAREGVDLLGDPAERVHRMPADVKSEQLLLCLELVRQRHGV